MIDVAKICDQVAFKSVGDNMAANEKSLTFGSQLGCFLNRQPWYHVRGVIRRNLSIRAMRISTGASLILGLVSQRRWTLLYTVYKWRQEPRIKNGRILSYPRLGSVSVYPRSTGHLLLRPSHLRYRFARPILYKLPDERV